MKQVEISYEELENQMIQELSKLGSEGLYQRGILATSVNDYVTARRMRIIPDGLTLYGVTDRGLRKTQQIMANPNVAIVAGFVQIEGEASLRGHPFDEPEFISAYKATMPETYDQWRAGANVTRERDMVVIQIVPKRISLWRYADPSSGIERGLYILNVEKRQAHKTIDAISVNSDPKDAPAYLV